MDNKIGEKDKPSNLSGNEQRDGWIIRRVSNRALLASALSLEVLWIIKKNKHRWNKGVDPVAVVFPISFSPPFMLYSDIHS